MANLYGNKWIGYAYDMLASLIWLPSKNKMYNKAVSLLSIQANESVLELGCGTGFLTSKLIAKQAIVTSIDQSAGMLARAKERVPNSTFIQADILQYADRKRYDYVLLFFVLHELNATERTSLLKSAKEMLNETGRIIICDFAVPDKGMMKTLFPKLLRLWEPQSTIDVLKNGFYAEINENKLSVAMHTKLHNGRVQFLKLKAA